jgi:hypothetical protein
MRMTAKKTLTTFWLGLAAGAVGGIAGGIALGRRSAAARRMPRLAAWQRAMATTRGKVGAATVAAMIQTRYDQLYAGRTRFSSPPLRDHLENGILPALALYQTLLELGGDRSSALAEALAEVEALFRAVYGRYSKGLALFGRLPNAFGLLRRLTPREMEAFPHPAGWEVEWLEDSDECLAFDMHRCFYLNVLTAYGAPELTPLFCLADDLLYESLSPTIRWLRTGTLARGDDRCDFRWCRGEGEPA